MISARTRLSRVSAAIALSFALATAPAAAAPGYLKLGDIKGEANDEGHKDQFEILSWSWETSRSAATDAGDAAAVRPGTAAPAGEKAVSKSGDRGGTEDAAISVITDKALPRLSKSPAPQGSLTAMVPAGICKSGARYPTAELGADGRVYRMSDVIVTSCSAPVSTAGGGGRPMEQISLDYSRVEVRGWDPVKKESIE